MKNSQAVLLVALKIACPFALIIPWNIKDVGSLAVIILQYPPEGFRRVAISWLHMFRNPVVRLLQTQSRNPVLLDGPLSIPESRNPKQHLALLVEHVHFFY
jgi:hypothetical protein